MDFLKKFFSGAPDGTAPDSVEEAGHDIRVATCALFLEMAEVDGEFSEEERERIVSILKQEYNLTDEHAAELERSAREELAGSLDIWQFTNRINENYSESEKRDVMRLVWRIVFADGKLDAHEDYLVKKMAKLLRLSHGEMIETKMDVLREVKGGEES